MISVLDVAGASIIAHKIVSTAPAQKGTPSMCSKMLEKRKKGVFETFKKKRGLVVSFHHYHHHHVHEVWIEASPEILQ